MITGETYQGVKSRVADGIIALLSTIYSLWVIIFGTADVKTFTYGMILLASGLIFYRPKSKRRTKVKQNEMLSA
ncbi:hypothetical protein [Neobacillus novalis]|uniref:hypothetical protein n=1 Tax=Neobacillus novalis TaxID=220687 RepID=UPI000B2A2E04